MARLRAVVVVAVVLVLGAWSCQVPTDSPGSAGSADVPISTTGLTALVAGEDWHYVGEAGEPSFENGWTNVVGGRNLAFRIREAGVVDIQGLITNSNSPTAPAANGIFTLPVGYRPSATSFQGAAIVSTDVAADGPIAAHVSVTTAGLVYVGGLSDDPFLSSTNAGAFTGAAKYVTMHGFLFLEPSSTP